MFRFGICEDDKRDQRQIYDMVSHVLFQYDDVEYTYFSDGREVMEAIEREEFDLDLLFLDIHMPGVNGLEAARYIRENQIDVDIIFVTVSTEYVFDGYTYRAFSYLLKPLEPERLAEEITRYIAAKRESSRCLSVNINGHRAQIPLDRVLYFAGEGRKVRVFWKKNEDEPLLFYAKLGDVEAMLAESGFVRCHQSYLVNSQYIRSYSRTEVQIGEGTLPVSRKYIENIREKLV